MVLRANAKFLGERNTFVRERRRKWEKKLYFNAFFEQMKSLSGERNTFVREHKIILIEIT